MDTDPRDYADTCDYNYLKKQIKDVLRKYFEYNDYGEPNDAYDPNLDALAALDEIHEIVGEI